MKRNSIEKQMIGDEPNPETFPIISQSDLIQAYSWYNYTKSSEDAKKWVCRYKPEFEKELKKVPDFELRTIGWTYRLRHNGYEIPEEILEKIESKVSGLIEKYQDMEIQKQAYRAVKEANENLARIKEADDTIYVLEDRLQDVKNGLLPPDFDFYQWFLKTGVDQFIAGHILQKCDWLDDEPVIREGLEKLSNLKRIVRKPIERKLRAKKPPNPKTLVKKLLYRAECAELGLKSVSPVDIIGAKEVWLYDTEKRVLCVLRGESMTVRGTTIFDWDEKKSLAKKVRKPEDVIKGMSKAIGRMVKTLKGLTTKPCHVLNRTSENTIILKVVK